MYIYMDNELQVLLDKMNWPLEDRAIFEEAKLLKVLCDKKLNVYTFLINIKTNLSPDLFNTFIDKLKDAFYEMKVMVIFQVLDKNYELVQSYFEYLMKRYGKKCPILTTLIDAKVVINGSTLNIEVSNIAEKSKLESLASNIIDDFNALGFDNLVLDITINTKKSDELYQSIENDKNKNSMVDKERLDKIDEVIVPDKNTSYKRNYIPKPIETEDHPNVILGRLIDTDMTRIDVIIGTVNNIAIEGEIFGIEFKETRAGFIIAQLKITDYTDSIYGKIFINDQEDYKRLQGLLKVGEWYKFRGSIKDDRFSGEETLNIQDINISNRKLDDTIDDAPVKRVELHAHTTMSQMDGLVDAKVLCKTAKKWGHKAIAITDHNGCQSFPDVYHFVCDVNKGVEKEEDKFKALYGTEITMIDDTVQIVLRPTDDDLVDNTYVVFDTETTGFNAGGGDQMIEIGAVKINNGEIIDRFDELINPNRKLHSKITELTHITDDMLEDKDTEENVVKRFMNWVGDLPMVAHNAKFDVSFIEMAFSKYKMGEFTNTVIDTLELSRTLDNNYARHSLSALVKRYNVVFDEDAHHRADYDAEGTALVFHKMLQKLDSQNYEKISDLDRLVSRDEIHKYGRAHHVNLLVKNKVGLKNLFKIISLANTTYLYKTPRILRSEIEKHREGLLVGSGCYESEVFTEAKSKGDEELTNIINFYDYVEVQPPDVYDHLIQSSDFANYDEVLEHIKKIIRVTKDAGRIIVATGDVHHLKPEDRMYREIIVNQKVPGGGRHPLARNSITKIPSQHFRTTREMLEAFDFLDEDLAYEIVVLNTNKIADMVEIIEVIIETGGVPFSPKIANSVETVTELVYNCAKAWYGDPLPYNIEERIAKELYGDCVANAILEQLQSENVCESDLEHELFDRVHKVILEGFDAVKKLVRNNIKLHESALTDEELDNKLQKNLGGIIGGGFDVIYLIAQKLVKHSNDDGYLVGSRGSVGSSFVATMMGITEVNPLPAHYRCLECQYSLFDDDDGNPLGANYSSGFDLPNKKCPKCGADLYKDGQDMPFATFLGFNADKVPDIDLNFSDLNQADAHEYTKVLFGVDNVYRAGTIGTVAEKTAFGFVKGYCEDHNIIMRTAEIERLAMGCTGVKRTTGQHPGGIVVVPNYMDVFDFTPFQYPADDATSAWRTTHFDYHAIDQDLLKLDILGHSDPTQLRMIQDLTKTDILKVPLDDKETMSLFTGTEALGVTSEQIMCKTGTLGIPEFGTPFTIGMVEETKPKTFAELIKISGLSHGTDVWLGNAQELIRNKIVPFKDVIGCRDDIMVYLMYKGVEPIKAFKIMEFVRKGKASKDPETWAKHKETMEKAGIESWFIESCGKIKYMFPKAHAAAYVISAFRIAWYKVHMPVYFYASWLTSKATDTDIEVMLGGYSAIKKRIIEIQEKGYDATNKEMGQLESLKVCLEATARGIKFLPVDLDKSEATVWGVKDEKSIYPPFSSIDGLGVTVAQKIVTERDKRPFLSVEEVQHRAKISATLMDRMRMMNIFDGMEESNQLSLF